MPWRRGFLPLKSELESLSLQLQQNMDQRDVMEVRHSHTARTQSRDDGRGQESSLKAAKTERKQSISSSQIYQLVSPSTSSGMSESNGQRETLNTFTKLSLLMEMRGTREPSCHPKVLVSAGRHEGINKTRDKSTPQTPLQAHQTGHPP